MLELVLQYSHRRKQKNCTPEGAQKKCFPSFALTRIAATQSRPTGMRKRGNTFFQVLFPAGAKIYDCVAQLLYYYLQQFAIVILTFC